MECRNKVAALSVGIIITDGIIPRSGGRQHIAFRHPQLQSTLFEDWIGSEQEAFMTSCVTIHYYLAQLPPLSF